MPWKRREEKECKRAEYPFKERREIWKMCGERTMDIEDETESRKKLDEQKKNCRRSYEMSKDCYLFQRNTREYQRVPAAPAARGGEKEAASHA